MVKRKTPLKGASAFIAADRHKSCDRSRECGTFLKFNASVKDDGRSGKSLALSLPMLIVWLSYFIQSTIYTSNGPLIPPLSKTLSLTAYQIGLLGAVLAIGFALSLFTGLAADLFGRMAACIAGYVLVIGALLTLIIAYNFSLALLAFFLFGMGVSFLYTTMGALVVDVFSEQRGFAVNLLHSFFGAGALTGPILTALLVGRSASWQLAAEVLTLMAILAFIIMWGIPFKSIAPIASVRLVDVPQLFRNRAALLIMICGLLEFGFEMSLTTWLVYLLMQSKDFPYFSASVTLGLVGLMIIPGRLIWSFYADRFGKVRLLRLTSGPASLFLLSAALSDRAELTMVLFAVSSFLTSAIVPTAIAAFTEKFPKMAGTATGAMFAFGGIGGLFFRFLLGLLLQFMAPASVTLLFPAIVVGVFLVTLGLGKD